MNCPNGEDESHCGATDFETDMGGWQDASDTTYGWSRITGSLSQYPNCTAPGRDHSTGLPEGYYVWAPAKLSGEAEIPMLLGCAKTIVINNIIIINNSIV